DAVPAREAVVRGDRRVTYQELEARANRLAHALAARGIGQGDHVAVYLVNSIEHVETLLAVCKLRAVPINVNYRYVEDELLYVLDDSDARALVFDRNFATRVAGVRHRLPRLETLLVVDDGTPSPVPGSLGALAYEDALAGGSAEREFSPRSADDL